MNFKRQFAASAAWSSIGSGTSSLISFIVFAMVVRTVDVEAIGVAAFAMAFIIFGRIFVETGAPELILRQPEFDHRYASVAFWLCLAVSGFVVVFFTLVLAPIIDRTFVPGSGIVLSVLSLSLFADSTRVVHEAKFRRDFRYRELAMRNIAGTVVSGVVGVAAAYSGFGVWALVAQRLVASAVTTIVTWAASDWRPSLIWSGRDAAHQATHGVGLLGASMLRTAIQRLPELALGLSQGPLAVAIYGVGIRAYEALYQLTAFPLLSAALSSFARLPDRESLGNAYVSTTAFFSTLSFPLFFGTAVIAEYFVPMVFGSKWEASSMVLVALAVSAPPTILGIMLHPVLNTLGQTRLIFALNLGSAGVVLLACAVLAPYGPAPVAAALAVRAYLGLGVLLLILKREVGVSPRSMLVANAPPFLASLAMLSVTFGVRSVLPAGLADPLVIAILVLVGVLTYLSILLFGFALHASRVVDHAGDLIGVRGLARYLPRHGRS